MTLQTLWFIIIAVLWTGFFILEGFDLGVGMLHGVLGKDEAGRRAAINTIGPLWDGNEVWLIVAAAAMFAAFPGVVRDDVLRLLRRGRAAAGGADRARDLLRVPREGATPTDGGAPSTP